tara:strand:+ start:324 stop:728 length:405 start_codon:yes stop_codon:yes gene_type:complete
MKDKFKKITLRFFTLIFLIFSTLIMVHTEELHASENAESVIVKKASQSFTKKYCNSIGFGLSKESAMDFSLKENNQVFNKRKEFNTINKESLAEEIAIAVIEKCGYPINLSGQKGILEFKSYYLSKDQESSETK